MKNEKWTKEDVKEFVIGMLEGLTFVAFLASGYAALWLYMG